MQPYPRALDLVWPGHLHGTGCLSARAVGTGFPTVGLGLWLGPGCGWSWVLFTPARCGWGLGWVCLGSVCGVVPLLPAVCGVRGWALVWACFQDLCGFLRVSLAPRRFRFRCAVWAPGSRLCPALLGWVVGLCFLRFFFSFRLLGVLVPGLVVSPPSPFFRAGLLAFFFFFLLVPVSLFPVGRCRWLGVARLGWVVPLCLFGGPVFGALWVGGLAPFCVVGGRFGGCGLFSCARPPPPFFFFVRGGGACRAVPTVAFPRLAVALWLVCGVVGVVWLGFASGGVGGAPPLLAGVRWRRCCVVCGVWRWCVGGVVAGVWCGWSLATPGGGSCVLLPATPGWVSLPVVVGGPRHSWLGSACGGGVWCVVCGVWRWCVGGVVAGVWCGWSLATPGGGSFVLLPATPGWVSLPVVVGGPRHSWLGSVGGVAVWCVVCGGGVLVGLWLVCGVVGPSPLLAEVPVCYSPPLLAGFRCRWWWAVPATPGWGPLAALLCGVWCVALVCWWGCGWRVVWLVPRHSWRRFLCATPRHSWLGFAAGGGGRSPPLLAGVRLRRWCVVCGVWCVAVVCWWGCGWCVVWLVPRHSWRRFLCATHRHSWLGFAAAGGGRSPPLLAGVLWRRWCVVCCWDPSPLLAEVPVCYSPPLLAGFRCRWWWAVPATPGWGPLAAVVCVFCLAGSGGPASRARSGAPHLFLLAALSFCFAWPPPGWGCPSLFRCCCRSSLAGVCGVWVGCCLAPVRVPWFFACCARSPGLWHPAAVAAWHLSVCPGCGRRRASLACLVAPRGAPRLVRSGRSRRSGRLSRRRGAFPHPGSLRPRLYWAAARGTRRPAENRAHCACRWPPPRQGRWARCASYPFGAPRWGCPWRVPPASVLGCVRWLACVDPVTDASGFPYRPSFDGGLGRCTGAVSCGRRHLPLRVGGRHARVPCVFACACSSWPGRAGRPPGRVLVRLTFSFGRFVFLLCLAPSGLGLPLSLSVLLLFLVGCFSRPPAAWLAPRLCLPLGRWLLFGGCSPAPPPPFVSRGFGRSCLWPWGVFFFFSFFFFLRAPPLSPAFSGFRPRVPWASALALCVLLALRFSALRALFPLSCFPPGCWLLPRPLLPPPPPFVSRGFRSCRSVLCAVLCCASLGAVPLLVAPCPLALPIALGPCALRRCVLGCAPALCALCCVCFVVARWCLLLFAALPCAVCVSGCCAVRSLCSLFCAVLCFAVLVPSRCAVRVVRAVAGAWCCGALLCVVLFPVVCRGAVLGLVARGCLLVTCFGVAVPAWPRGLLPCGWCGLLVCCGALLSCVVFCGAVLSRGAVLLCSAVVLRCFWGLLCPPVGCRAVLCCAVGWLSLALWWCLLAVVLFSSRCAFPVFSVLCAAVPCCAGCGALPPCVVCCGAVLGVVLCCRAVLSLCGAVCVLFALLRPVVRRLCGLRCCWCLVLWRVPVRCGVSLGVLRCGGAALVCRGVVLCCALSCGVLRSVPCPAVSCCPAVLCCLFFLLSCFPLLKTPAVFPCL